MKKILIAFVGFFLGVLSVIALAPPAQAANSECVPSIVMNRPYFEAGSTYWSANYVSCGATSVKIKVRERGTLGWTKSTYSPGEPLPAVGETSAGLCFPDGRPRQWVAYATLKIGPTLLAASHKVHLNVPGTVSCG